MSSSTDRHQCIEAGWQAARLALLAAQNEQACWRGRLSSSALATAVATSAFAVQALPADRPIIERACQWLAADQHDDGGWGDSPESPSNLPTTLLVRAALQLAADRHESSDTVTAAERFLNSHGGPTKDERCRRLLGLYEPDKTFAVPILANLALAGQARWQDIPPLPFELACFPRGLYRFLRLEVVSYALPALIAIGQLLAVKGSTSFALTRGVRMLCIPAALNRLTAGQPENGGFLEAIPLTAFVCMGLAGAGHRQHEVLHRGLDFLRRGQRGDGSWPIDSDLALWLTTSAIQALSPTGSYDGPQGKALGRWLVGQQQRGVHVATGAGPGGWGWTDLPGAVPDADDTAGALLALARLAGQLDEPVTETVDRGLAWLGALQNSDGGWPTFCRGWGRLPFDQSSPDVTGHVLRALSCWRDGRPALAAVIQRGVAFLRRQQREDGSWLPLWFGSQVTAGGENPVFGTARVLAALGELAVEGETVVRARAYLKRAQHDDGSFGPAAGCQSSMEETAVAVDALSRFADDDARAVALRGGMFLAEQVAAGALSQAAPIGLYFSRLWYAEQLYPMIWTVGALGRLCRRGER